MCLKSGKLLHHLTILYSLWSAILHRLAIVSGVELLESMPALASRGFVDRLTAPPECADGWFSRVSSASFICHRCSTSMISCSSCGICGRFVSVPEFPRSSFLILPIGGVPGPDGHSPFELQFDPPEWPFCAIRYD